MMTARSRAEDGGSTSTLEFASSRLWQPNLIVFVSSACTMIVELVAGRIIAPYVGVSLYTWTSVIGVVLAGISLGNYVGGLLADRWASLRLLGTIFVLAGFSCLGILLVDELSGLTPDSWPVILGILILTTALFFVPSSIMGTVSPIVAKLSVRDLGETGSTVGKIYAAGAVGSIVGTFATGFVLISWFGTRAIVWGVAAVLCGLGLLFLLAGRRRLLAVGLLIVLVASAEAYQQGWLNSICTRETNYFCIKVEEQERDGKPVRVLILDRLVHSFTSLEDPTMLVYGYEQMYAEATAYQAQRTDHLRALFIGGGGYTFPRYMASRYPGSELDVIEIDPGVTRVAHELLGLSRDTPILTFNQDARTFFSKKPAKRYDLIFGDAFNDFSVPYHLTTQEFNQRVKEWLTPDGLYMVNIIDGAQGDFLRSYARTLGETYAHVYVAPTSELWRRSVHTTFVIIGSETPLDLVALAQVGLQDDDPYLISRMLKAPEMAALLSDEDATILTDDYAPVDQMLAPVFRDQLVGAAAD
jgi:spermidine synthase